MTSLFDVFRDDGYNVQGVGKLFHDDTIEVDHGKSFTRKLLKWTFDHNNVPLISFFFDFVVRLP